MFTKDSRLLTHRLTVPLTSVSKAVGDVFKPTYNQVLKYLFANNEQGFFYDPNDLSTMFQDAAGTVPVTAAGQPVGLILDKSKGLVLGGERLVNGDFSNGSANWSVINADATHVVTFANGKVRYQSDTVTPVLTLAQGGALVIGKWYEVTVVCSEYVSGSLKIDAGNGVVVVASGLGTFKTKILAASPSALILVRNAANTDLTIDSISVRELTGNHAYQTTSADRPILQQIPILGVELIADTTFKDPSYWTLTGGGWTIANDVASAVNATGGISKLEILKPNKTYEFVIKVNRVSGSFNLPYDGRGVNIQTRYESGTFKRRFTTSSDSHVFYATYGTNFTGTIEFISAKEVTGYRTDQNYIDYDGVDDKSITNLPAQLAGCTVIRSVPNVGTQILTNQTIPATYNDNTDHCGLIVISRALTPSETSAITTEFNKRAGV